MRVEDTDQERSTQGSEQLILDSLEWLGIQANEGPRQGGPYAPYRQSERLDLFNKYKDQLIHEKKAYRCFCSNEELKVKQEQAKAKDQNYIYDGTCRELDPEVIETKLKDKIPHTIRFATEIKQITVQDAVQGEVNFHSKIIGDFIIIKSNGFPAYNYAVVIDDFEMQITHVIRGVGHLSNTPRQVLLHEALGFKLPVYAHISEIVGTDKKKLSKRRGATSILLFRDLGYLPEAFVNYMALLGWYPRDDIEYMPKNAIEKKFDLEHCSKSPAMFDFFLTNKSDTEDFDPASISHEELMKKINNKSKLNWLNNKYIKDAELSSVWPLVEQAIHAEKSLTDLLKKDPEQIKKSFQAIKVYINTIPEAIAYFHELFDKTDKITDEEALKFMASDNSKKVVYEYIKILSEKKPATPQEFSELIKQTGKNTSVKGKELFMPIRIASTARMQGMELPSLFSILGWQEVVDRIKKLAGI